MSEKAERKARDLEHIAEPEKIGHLVKNYLVGKSMFLKGSDPPAEVRLKSLDERGNLVVNAPHAGFARDQTVSLFRILGRYIELSCLVVGASGTDHRLAVQGASIAKKERKAMRIPVRENDVHINNIRTSKNKIDATLFNIPTSVKVNFGAYEQTLKGKYDFVKIDVYSKRGTVTDEIRKTGRCVFVGNTQEPEAYEPLAMHVLDYKEFLGDGLAEQMREYKRNKVVSEAIVPIGYVTHDESLIPLGYIQVQSHKQPFGPDVIMELQQAAFEMVDRIRDSNTVLVQEPQAVQNFSRGGLKVLIQNQELRNYLVRQNGFTFDLFFRGQAPITLYGLIRSTRTLEDGNLLMGIQIQGNSSRPGEMKRFLDNITLQEKRIKDILEKRKKLMGQKG